MHLKKWIGIHAGGPHYLDHLGVLCAGLSIPLIVSEEETFHAASLFYPDLQIELLPLNKISIDFLSQNASVIFESGHYFTAEFLPLCKLLHGKAPRVVYCPHGNSDKSPGKIPKDISLIYGEHMKQHLQTTGEIDHIQHTTISGNYRALYYKTHQRWLQNLLTSTLNSRLINGKKTIFYAPTYDASSFSQTSRVIEELAPSFNLLIRWHPFLSNLYPAEYEKFDALCTQTSGVVNLSSFHSIYPILDKADIYLGDASSIGYDFLTFNKPLFFLESSTGAIYETGHILQPHEHWGHAITQFQDTPLLVEKRNKLAAQVFGHAKSFQALRQDLEEILQLASDGKMVTNSSSSNASTND